jgi:hypothetical protein
MNADDTRMQHFRCLDQAEQAAAIRRLRVAGQSEYSIAAATGLSVEQICCVLAAAPSSPSRWLPARVLMHSRGFLGQWEGDLLRGDS